MTPTPLPGDELKGRALGGRYRMLRLLGRGGMGAVWVAHDERDGVEVAVKVVKASLVEDEAALARFRREMKVMAGLTHDNIVRGLDAGEDDGVLWLAMELLRGETLRERLDARGRLPWLESLGVVRQIALGLGAAHSAGVVHRDLKPENIMIVSGEDGGVHVKLLDFGVAKASQSESGQSSMTGTGFVVGTPGYVAPEVVLDGKTNDPRTDFYALGVVWYEMVSGQKPFTAKTAFALAMRHAHERPPSFAEIAPFAPVPTPVENVVLRLMGKSPDERPPDAATLLTLVDGLEKGAQAAAAGTPLPDAFDATVTDVRETPNSTAVVPLKLTATPRSDAAAALTPATGLAPAPGSASPSSGIHLFRQLPTPLKVLMVSGAVLLPLFTVGVVAWVVVDRTPPPGDGTGPTPARADVGTDLIVRGSSEDTTVEAGKGPPPQVPSVLPPGTDGSLERRMGRVEKMEPIPEVDGNTRSAEERIPLAPTPPRSNPKTRIADRRDTPPPSRTAPAPVEAQGKAQLGSWSFGAPGRSVTVELDGKKADDPPILRRPIQAGVHALRVFSEPGGVLVLERTFTVTAGENVTITLPQAEP